MSIYVGDTEIKDISLGEGLIDYSAMQGPCADGYHVPLKDEWDNLYGILTNTFGLPSNTSTFKTYLKMPLAGYRDNNGSITYQGSIGCYWTSTYSNTTWTCAYYLNIEERDGYTGVRPAGATANGYSIRPFKDTPVAPDNTWTTLYDGSSTAPGAGVFRNSSLGIMSISGDGNTWITIADKNLGAKVTYGGNAAVSTNSGNYYQRGNNYGFPFTGSITTSSTKVDDSNYGPGNYYSSSTFIITSGTPYQWGTSDNLNLRGGVTGIVKKGNVKEVYVGDTKVRPKPRTFTISWTEQSNMSSGWTYSDDAAGLTAGSTAFDEFFGYSAVRLSSAGVETAEVTQTTPGQLDFSQLGTLTSGDNVMIKFPRLGIKMSKSGSIVTLSITDGPNREADGFQYYAHSRGTLSSPIKKDALYLGAFMAYNNSNVLKSWSGKSPVVSITQQNCINYARANDGNIGSAGYDIIGFYQREFINALYMMKYGNPNSQSVIGKGYSGGSSRVDTGGTVSQLSATYGTTSATQQVKLFGLEDWWGNVHEWLGGMCTDGSKNLWTALSGFVGNITTTSPYENTGDTIQRTSGNDLSSIVGNNKGLFAPNGTVSNSNNDTYYCDALDVNASRLAMVGGRFADGSNAGVFYVNVSRSASFTAADIGARLMYL